MATSVWSLTVLHIIISVVSSNTSCISRNQTHSTRTAEVYMPWWKGGQHSGWSSNQVCPFWYPPSGWQNGSRV